MNAGIATLFIDIVYFDCYGFLRKKLSPVCQKNIFLIQRALPSLILTFLARAMPLKSTVTLLFWSLRKFHDESMVNSELWILNPLQSSRLRSVFYLGFFYDNGVSVATSCADNENITSKKLLNSSFEMFESNVTAAFWLVSKPRQSHLHLHWMLKWQQDSSYRNAVLSNECIYIKSRNL